MSADGSSFADSTSSPATASNGNGWHAIRPWSPPLSLVVREITSVSATFILSSGNVGDMSSSLASLGLEDQSSVSSLTEDKDRSSSTSAESVELDPPVKSTIIVDALAKGLSVTVNGSSWQRVFIRIDDKIDEAVIIIYGLMPGRQYDITLGLVQGQVQRQVTTTSTTTGAEESDGDSSSSNNTTADTSTTFSSTDPSRQTHENSISPTSSPSSTPPQPTIEERLAQLQQTLSMITTEKESLISQLKSARKESQKQDAALRSEIDILKRNSEKHAQVEHRAKQKILALQEAVKRAQAGIKDTEELFEVVQGEIPELEKQKVEKEKVYLAVKARAEKVRREREEEEERERKKMEGMRTELGALGVRMEKLSGKKEKLEGSVPELEERLRDIEEEIERVEREEREEKEREEREKEREDSRKGASWGVFDMDDYEDALGFPPSSQLQAQQPIRRPSRTQNSSNSSAATSASIPLPPIGRPLPSTVRPLAYQQHHPQHSWNTPPRQLQSTQPQQGPRSNSLPLQYIPTQNPLQQQSQAAFILQRRESLTKTSPKRDQAQAQSASPGNTTLSSRAPPFEPTNSTGIMLSRAAPAFEPGKGLVSTKSSSGFGVPEYPSTFPTPANGGQTAAFTSPGSSSASSAIGVNASSVSPTPIQRPAARSPGTIGKGRAYDGW
ncbi:hypothetical protein BDQ17DRAFT_1331344 [Cyathus striatus]|nr:hypothetical protein BDQ17DRAFT_1331344 [Cyathus striatus]